MCLHIWVCQGEGVTPGTSHIDEHNCQIASTATDLNNCTTGNFENWMVLSIAGDKPTPRFNVMIYWFPRWTLSFSVLFLFGKLLELGKCMDTLKVFFFFFKTKGFLFPQTACSGRNWKQDGGSGGWIWGSFIRWRAGSGMFHLSVKLDVYYNMFTNPL